MWQAAARSLLSCIRGRGAGGRALGSDGRRGGGWGGGHGCRAKGVAAGGQVHVWRLVGRHLCAVAGGLSFRPPLLGRACTKEWCALPTLPVGTGGL